MRIKPSVLPYFVIMALFYSKKGELMDKTGSCFVIRRSVSVGIVSSLVVPYLLHVSLLRTFASQRSNMRTYVVFFSSAMLLHEDNRITLNILFRLNQLYKRNESAYT